MGLRLYSSPAYTDYLRGDSYIIPRDYLLDVTDWKRVPDAFRPGKATRYYGYGYKFWLFPGEKRRFALLGVYGQMIFVDPELKLVMVQTTANATAKRGRRRSRGKEMRFGEGWWVNMAAGEEGFSATKPTG